MARVIYGICIVFASALAGGETPPGAVPLATELKVSGPEVAVRSPLGLRYRPGCSFPLQVYVHNPGAGFDADVQIVEGDGESGSRSSLRDAVTFPAGVSRILSLPVRGGSVTANLTLSIREVDKSSGVGPLRFRASLSKIFKPLAPEGRIVVSCGTIGSALPHGGLYGSAQIAAKDFPDEAWMYESIDLVILGDPSLKDVPPAAKAALRQWLLGGGRLLVASNDALPGAIAAGLFPLELAPAEQTIGADRAWWEQHAGLAEGDILASKNNRPVYARLKIGLGQVVFLFPATRMEDASEFGTRIFTHPALQRESSRLPDFRVQPDRYEAFTSGSATASRRDASMKWIVLGALAMCASLAMASSSRSRLVAIGWPIALMALLAVMLANWFPVPELIVSRIEVARVSEDGRAFTRHEWTCVETFHDSCALSADGPVGGSMTPLYSDTAELKSSETNYMETDQRLSLQNMAVIPNQPLLVFAAGTRVLPQSHALPPASSLHSKSGKFSLNYRTFGGGDDEGPGLADSIGRSTAALLCSEQCLWLVTELDSKNGFAIRRLDDLPSVVREALHTADDSLVNARVAALRWVSREAFRSGRDTLIFLNPPPQAALCELENSAENGSRFVLCSMSVTLSGKPEN